MMMMMGGAAPLEHDGSDCCSLRRFVLVDITPLGLRFQRLFLFLVLFSMLHQCFHPRKSKDRRILKSLAHALLYLAFEHSKNQ